MKTADKVNFDFPSTTPIVPGLNMAGPNADPNDPDPFDPEGVGPGMVPVQMAPPREPRRAPVGNDEPPKNPVPSVKRPEPPVGDAARDPYLHLKENGVTQSMIDQWKKQWGDVALCVLGAGGAELYIVRPVFADEYIQIQQALDREQQTAMSQGMQYGTQDRVRTYRKLLKQHCQLWTNVPASSREKAGTLYTIGAQVELISNFMDENEVAMNVVML